MAKPKQHYNPNPPLDRDALHQFLWDRANNKGRITIHQGQLAESLDVTRGTVVRVLKEMVEAGRLAKVDSLEKNLRVYQVVEPDVWSGKKPPAPRKLAWG